MAYLENKRVREGEATFDEFTGAVKELFEEFEKREDQILREFFESEEFKKVQRAQRDGRLVSLPHRR
jgi:hypothetical protein